MITIENIRNVRQGQYDEVYAIVRYYKGHSEWIKHMPDLSPSQPLWTRFHQLRLSKQWNADTFRNIYLPRFLSEMHGKAAREKLNELVKLDREGKSVALVCFCQDEALCHRSIVAGLLKGVGCNVVAPSGADYTEYYKLYIECR